MKIGLLGNIHSNDTLERTGDGMSRSQYQPTNNKQLTAAQEVHYTSAFKQADIAGGYRRRRVEQAKKENKN